MTIHVLRLEQTCRAFPSQWGGRTSDGDDIYIRFRGGELSVGVGPTLDDAVDAGYESPAFIWHCDDPSAGEMTTADMIRRMPESITFALTASDGTATTGVGE